MPRCWLRVLRGRSPRRSRPSLGRRGTARWWPNKHGWLGPPITVGGRPARAVRRALLAQFGTAGPPRIACYEALQ
eukprot:14102125-Alexandrium_andersonii.AAC.1